MELYEHQIKAIKQMKNGCVLCGGTGTGKSMTALGYYMCKVCDGYMGPQPGGTPIILPEETRPLYIITTAKKRDDNGWDADLERWGLSRDIERSHLRTPVIVDSWNNIKKYTNVVGAMFIFDEQRVVGTGAWVKAFLKITKKNRWVLLSATPGDEWKDYIPLFVANGFYKNKTDFAYKHIVYSPYTKYPKIQYYIHTKILEHYRKEILIVMKYEKPTLAHNKDLVVPYDPEKYALVWKDRWNPYTNEPIVNQSELIPVLRRVVNSDPRRLEAVEDICRQKTRVIIFYNYLFEKDMLKAMCKKNGFTYAEWNGQKHERVPDTKEWVYLVQYFAGNEAWECITTDTIIFYSLNYSYKVMTQASGRIDRINTPYKDLYFYHVKSLSDLDQRITRSLNRKEDFNEKAFVEEVQDEEERKATDPLASLTC